MNSNVGFVADREPIILPRREASDRRTSSSLSRVELVIRQRLFRAFFLGVTSRIAKAHLRVVNDGRRLSATLRRLSTRVVCM